MFPIGGVMRLCTHGLQLFMQPWATAQHMTQLYCYLVRGTPAKKEMHHLA
jgi:hypothetical protein